MLEKEALQGHRELEDESKAAPEKIIQKRIKGEGEERGTIQL